LSTTHNSALAGVSKVYLQKLQSVQNKAARNRMVSGVRRCEHITPVLEDLHKWMEIPDKRGSVTDTVFINYKKAFDIVNGNTLLSKLLK